MKTITKRTMINRFQQLYPKLYNELVRIYVYEGLSLIGYFKDGSFVIFDYCEDKIVEFLDRPKNSCPNDEDEEYEYEIDVDDFIDHFSKAVIYYMNRREMTQKDLAAVTGIHYNTIGRYLKGERQPTLMNACKIANALGCRVEDISLQY